MKKKLLEIGQSPEDIKNMRPQEAQRILKNHSEQSRSVENFEHNMHTKQSEKTIDCFQRDDVKAEIPPLNKPVPFL